MKRTVAEMRRLTAVARRLGSFQVSARERQFVCPVHYETKPRDAGVSHRFSVHVHPWENPDREPVVRAALARHLEDQDDNGEPCEVSA